MFFARKCSSIGVVVVSLSVGAVVVRAADAAGAPVDIRNAYGLSGTTRTTYQGDGVTIAVFASSGAPYAGLQADVTYFSSAYGVPDVALKYYDSQNLANNAVSGKEIALSTTGTATSSELAMDIEYAHYMAPKARIVIVSGDSYGGAAQYAATALGATVFTTSFAGYESSLNTATEKANAIAGSNRFDLASQAGLTAFSAAGDSGPYDYPASSPFVVGVGATNLYVNNQGLSTATRSSELSWSTTGGGTSAIFATPDWQKKVNPGAYRKGPDVAIVGSGLNTMPVRVGGAYSQIAGTSLSSPLWAGIMAVVQEARLDAGKEPLGTTDFLTAVYGLVGTPDYARAFYDITSSPSGATNVAAAGFDTASGLGTPKVPFLVSYLVSVPEPTSVALLGMAVSLLGRRRRA